MIAGYSHGDTPVAVTCLAAKTDEVPRIIGSHDLNNGDGVYVLDEKVLCGLILNNDGLQEFASSSLLAHYHAICKTYFMHAFINVHKTVFK